ncbi:MAG: 30S ribosomal protein S9 [Acidobacteria bacterium]|nr:30S ribosomal protein S9 [Acidobacteriota bacterium]
MATKVQFYGTGRRKTAVARVFLRPGAGKIFVNRLTYEDYFKTNTQRMMVRQPLLLTENLSKFDLNVTVMGGGLVSQAGAVRHGIARALVDFNSELRLKLKQAKFLTRDPRKKERKKYGQPGARRRYQYSKR